MTHLALQVVDIVAPVALVDREEHRLTGRPRQAVQLVGRDQDGAESLAASGALAPGDGAVEPLACRNRPVAVLAVLVDSSLTAVSSG